MTRYSQFKLINGGGSRISDVPETDAQIIASLRARWGDQVVSVTVDGRVLEVRT